MGHFRASLIFTAETFVVPTHLVFNMNRLPLCQLEFVDIIGQMWYVHRHRKQCFPYFDLLMSKFMQSYLNINLHESTLYIIRTFIVESHTRDRSLLIL
jgi:hypothetical protein